MKVITAALLFLLTIPGLAAPKTIFEFLDFEGSETSTANGINNLGDIIGTISRQEDNGIRTGFIKKASGELILLGQNVIPNGIDDQGRVVGYSNDGSFLYQNGQYTPLVFPGATYTVAAAISEGRIVGIADINGHRFGFLFENGNWTRLDVPGASSTSALGISGDTIVGGFYSDTFRGLLGFVYEAGQFRIISPPPGEIQLNAVNSKGVLIGRRIVGCGTMPIAIIRGEPLFVDLPDVSVAGINDKNIIVGTFGHKGFIAKLNSFLRQ